MSRALMTAILGAGLLASMTARADTPAREPRRFEPSSLAVYSRLGGGIYLSRVQTSGGIGGGLGVRVGLGERFVLQADATHLSMIGSTVALRVGAGVERRGTWAPMALLTGNVFLGDRLRFYTPEHPAGPSGPPGALGVALAPLRFRTRTTEVSLLELGTGLGWDFPGLGTAYTVSLLEVAVSL